MGRKKKISSTYIIDGYHVVLWSYFNEFTGNWRTARYIYGENMIPLSLSDGKRVKHSRKTAEATLKAYLKIREACLKDRRKENENG